MYFICIRFGYIEITNNASTSFAEETLSFDLLPKFPPFNSWLTKTRHLRFHKLRGLSQQVPDKRKSVKARIKLVIPHCSKSSFYVQKFNFDFTEEKTWICYSSALFSVSKFDLTRKIIETFLGKKFMKIRNLKGFNIMITVRKFCMKILWKCDRFCTF